MEEIHPPKRFFGLALFSLLISRAGSHPSIPCGEVDRVSGDEIAKAFLSGAVGGEEKHRVFQMVPLPQIFQLAFVLSATSPSEG